jgi:hypothetical protein
MRRPRAVATSKIASENIAATCGGSVLLTMSAKVSESPVSLDQTGNHRLDAGPQYMQLRRISDIFPG